MDKSTITLSEPARKGDREITELTFAQIKVKHLLAADPHPDGSVAADVALTSALTGEPEVLIAELSLRDWVRVQGYLRSVVENFFVVPKSPAEGQSGDPTGTGDATEPVED